MFSSIKQRIIITFTAVILIAVVSLSLYLSHFFKENYISELENHLTEQAYLVANSSITSITQEEYSGLDAIAKDLGGQIEARITIINTDGTVLGDSEKDPNSMENHSDRPEVLGALSEGKGSSTRYSETINTDMLYVAVPILIDNDTRGIARLSISLEKINAALADTYSGIAIGGIIAVAITILLALQASRVVSAPIKRLSLASKQLAQGKLDQEIEVESSDEIGDLAHEFNYMAMRIKEMVNQLSGEHDRISLILSQMGDGIIMLDSESRITMVNDAAARIFDIDKENVKGFSFIEVYLDYEINEVIEKCMEIGKQQKKVMELKDKGLYLGIIATPMEDGNGCLMLVQDLAEIKRLENIRRDFFSNIAHELRTPISSVMALSETLRDGAIKDTGVADDFLKRIGVEMDRLNHLTEEMAELSNIESGEISLHKSLSRIEDSIRHAAGRLKTQADEKGVKLTFEFGENLPSLEFDAIKVEQVLVNLIHNAIKFTRTGDEVKTKATAKGGLVTVSIADKGIGIPKADLPRVFERFYKVDKARRRGSGTGLGLAIAKHTIQAHGGRIWAESEEGKWAVFSFTLPV